MTEQLAAVDAATEQAAGETAATEQNRSMDGSAEKTFTASQMDAEIKRRIDKQNAKHNTEMEELRARFEQLEKQAKEADERIAGYEREKQRLEMVAEVTKETGVDASLLRGDTKEELLENAKALAAAIPAYSPIKDSGKPHTPAKTSKDAFADFMKANFN